MVTYEIQNGKLIFGETKYHIPKTVIFSVGDIIYIDGKTSTRPELFTAMLAGAAQLLPQEQFLESSLKKEIITMEGGEYLTLRKGAETLFSLHTPAQHNDQEYKNFIEKRNQWIGYIFGEPRQYIIGSTVEEECLFSTALHCNSPASITLEPFGLKGKEHFKTERLSGGESHRLNFACVLGSKTPIVICDLSAANLDQNFLNYLLKFFSETKDERILFIYNGRRKDFLDISSHVLSLQATSSINTYSVIEQKPTILLQDIPPQSDDLYLDNKNIKNQLLLSVQGIQCDKRILNPISFELHRNEKLFLTGANGIGKTTLARILSDQMKPSSGHINSFPSFLKKIMTFQYSSSFPSDWLLERILSDEEIPEDWRSFLKIPYCYLPNGIKKYSYISFMLRLPADLYILDEPFAGMDFREQKVLLKKISNSSSSFIIFNHEKYISGSCQMSLEKDILS